jgi:eukaryotic-like serine/threonine-protein kinase
MPFPADTQFGPYKIVALIGSGGMGEVYRSRDTRLLRDVALKILPASFTNDPDRLRRFEQEARAVAALNHPNIVSVYDVGESSGVHYIVSELLEGDSLRERIPATGLAARKTIELAVQLANGLAAAHDKGIVHRDLKPENVFVLRNGQLKILDFGLAKLRTEHSVSETTTGVTVAATQTDAGQILGTVGYMSPEQVRGDAVDHRSDIFGFGSILYEMLSGQRVFKRNTSAETMTAILNEDPQDFPSRTSGAIAPALERIVRHCLEKQPGQRFQSAHDIAFDLESVSSVSATSASPQSSSRNGWLRPAAGAIALLAAGLALGVWLRPAPTEALPKLHRITFRRGTIWNARFTPDGNLIYAASWDGRPAEFFAGSANSTESRPFGSSFAKLYAISSSGEMAVSTTQRFVEGFEYSGMLARAPQGGGAPRSIAPGVEFADWSPDGSQLAVVRRLAGKIRLEYPLGKVLYETNGWISHPRLSPDGKLVAFIDHAFARDDRGTVAIIDLAGNKKTLSSEYVSLQGLAWWPDGNEIWFTGTTSGSSRQLRAVTLGKKERLVYLGTGTLTLYDVSKNGQVLVARDDWRAGSSGLAAGAAAERDLSWHDWTVPRDMSDDGKYFSFDETGEAGGETGAIFVRPMDGSPAVRLGDGTSPTLSPDGKRVLAFVGAKASLTEIPTGAGDSHVIDTGNVQVRAAFFFPDGHRILETGFAPGDHGSKIWVQDTETSAPRAITPEGVTIRHRGCISPDGTRVAGLDFEGKPVIYNVSGGSPTLVPGALEGDEPVQWTTDGKSLVVGHAEIPNRVFTINLATGKRTLFKEFSTVDPTGLIDNSPPVLSRDLKSYVYPYTRITSDLYVVDGLK